MTFTAHDLQTAAGILQDAASAELMPRFARTDALALREKTSSFDIVTEADLAMENTVSQALSAAFPMARVIGEEACATEPGLLQGLEQHALAFVLDPLDGTKNFASTLPLFGAMLAVLAHGRTIAGLIHDPVTGTTAHALLGGGAWLDRPGAPRQRLQVAAPCALGAMDCIVGTQFLPSPVREQVLARLPRLGSHLWLRCAAHEYRLAASGAMHALVYNKLMPWDHAAGVLIHQEAGGYSAFLDGEPYRPTRHAGGLICAPDAGSWRVLKEALFGSE